MYVADLVQSVARLPGVGPAKARDLAKMGVITIGDLLLHLPREYEDRTRTVPFSDASSEQPVNTVATVIAHSYLGRGPRMTLKIHLQDDTGSGVLVCFGRNFLARSLPEGKRIRIFGSFQQRFGDLQATAFEFEDAEGESRKFGRVLPVYPLAGKLSQHDLRRAVENAIPQFARNLDSELPGWLREKRGLLTTSAALEQIHLPGSVDEARVARDSLIYLELFFLQIGIALRSSKRRQARRPGRGLPLELLRKLTESLPYSLTGDQNQVVRELCEGLGSDVPMARLLQGDVGSGKTVVALLSALPVIEAGSQVALMAPTELLARQHAEATTTLFEAAGIDVNVALLSGSIGAAARKPLVSAIATGAVDLVIGTHAVFTPEVQFRNLQYVIIDEQHRFGVLQRLALMDKARQPDLLLMTATPIPRTLALTVFGDLEVSSIREMPPGRSPVETHLSLQEKNTKVYEFVRREIDAGRQAYFVYPVIDDTGKLNLKDAEGMCEELKNRVYPNHRVGLVHSRIPDDQKRSTMEEFRRGELDILVATTVVEVGVDVPNATCMVVEHAERFGLAALHQLRGRVGRGKHQSYCFLVYDGQLTDVAKERLKVMHRTNNGFEIAEEDLKIRGPGDFSGTQQSGYLQFRVADLLRDMEAMNLARSDAFDVLERDPTLQSATNGEIVRALQAAREAHRMTPVSYPDTLIPSEAPA